MAVRGYGRPGREAMDHDKLRQWLKLPDGPWPPDLYTLIGLPPGNGTAEDIEVRVLERLELLRRYQLPHPDEATEGMNFLARALDTLTDPGARGEYDRGLGIRSAVPAAARPAAEIDVDELFDSLFPNEPIFAAEPPPLPRQATTAEPTEPREADSAPSVVLELPEVADDLDVDDDPEFADGEVELPPAILVPVLPAIARLETHKPPQRPKSRHRAVYADLVRVRRVLRVWERARPYLADPARTFSRRTDSLALMGCLAELRPLLPTVSDLIGVGGRPGGTVAALVRQRLLFDTFRSLLPSQRESLAKDFRAAHYELADHYNDLRKKARRFHDRDFTRATVVPLLRYLVRNPEWILLPVALMAVAIAWWRSY